jgi:hypothetical protein
VSFLIAFNQPWGWPKKALRWRFATVLWVILLAVVLYSLLAAYPLIAATPSWAVVIIVLLVIIYLKPPPRPD